MEVIMSEFFMKKHFSANIKEVEPNVQNRNGIRIYKSTPTDITFQTRTFKPSSISGHGKMRNMMATVQITREEWEEICEYVDKVL